MKKLLISLMAAVAVIFVTCAADGKKENGATMAGAPVLVVFFSAPGSH